MVFSSFFRFNYEIKPLPLSAKEANTTSQRGVHLFKHTHGVMKGTSGLAGLLVVLFPAGMSSLQIRQRHLLSPL